MKDEIYPGVKEMSVYKVTQRGAVRYIRVIHLCKVDRQSKTSHIYQDVISWCIFHLNIHVYVFNELHVCLGPPIMSCNTLCRDKSAKYSILFLCAMFKCS